jgi:predicted protein tyrosine phosphatase
MSKMNRLGNSTNPFQGSYKKVLAVCSAGLLRSPTTAVILSQEPYNYNTRAAGLDPEFALIVVDDVLLHWADEVVCMTSAQQKKLKKMTDKPIQCLNIDDNFEYRNKELINLIKANYKRNENEKK